VLPFILGPVADVLAAEPPPAAVRTVRYKSGPRGLKYDIVKQGTGPTPQRAQQVRVLFSLYTDGFPEDGGKFLDSSEGLAGLEFNVGVNQVLKGLDLELLEMKEGETRRIIIPPELGYGTDTLENLPPNSTLYYEVNLCEVHPMFPLEEDQINWMERHPL